MGTTIFLKRDISRDPFVFKGGRGSGLGQDFNKSVAYVTQENERVVT